MYEILISKKAARNFNRLDWKYKEKILKVFFVLKTDPYFGKPLCGELKGLYSVRAWPYRIVYQIHKKQLIIHILNAGHRKDVYEIF